jgi:catechol 2,3-dioxygenase-like lactoylglutathione lyase family enzyme
MQVRHIDHVQLAMPVRLEDEAKAFYRDVLGIPEVAKPPHLAARGGCWFEQESSKMAGIKQEQHATVLDVAGYVQGHSTPKPMK